MEIIGIIVGILFLLLFLGALAVGFADACGEAAGEESIWGGWEGKQKMEKIKNFDESIDWTKGLMSKLKEGLEKGMWFQRLGMKFFVPPENINAYFDSTLGIVEIYFHSDNPCTMATYSIMSYKQRWALREEDLEDIYVEVEEPSEEAIKKNEERLEAARKVFK